MKYSLILASALAMAAGMSGAQTAAPTDGTGTTVPVPDTCATTGSTCTDGTAPGPDPVGAVVATDDDSSDGQDSDEGSDDDHGDDHDSGGDDHDSGGDHDDD